MAQVGFMNNPQSYEELNLKARLEEAGKMIQKLNQDWQQIAAQLRSKMVVEPFFFSSNTMLDLSGHHSFLDFGLILTSSLMCPSKIFIIC